METESQPWSKSSPKGVLDFVLLACFPSIASSDWYRNRPNAARSNAQAGSWKHRLNSLFNSLKLAVNSVITLNSVFRTGCQHCQGAFPFVIMINSVFKTGCQQCQCLLSSWWIQSLKLAVKTVKVPFVMMINSVFKTGCRQCLLSSWWIQSLKLGIKMITDTGTDQCCHKQYPTWKPQ